MIEISGGRLVDTMLLLPESLMMRASPVCVVEVLLIIVAFDIELMFC